MTSRDIETANRLYEQIKTIVDLPEEAISICLHLEVGEAPTVTVKRFVLNGEGYENPATETKRFRIVDPEEAE